MGAEYKGIGRGYIKGYIRGYIGVIYGKWKIEWKLIFRVWGSGFKALGLGGFEDFHP